MIWLGIPLAFLVGFLVAWHIAKGRCMDERQHHPGLTCSQAQGLIVSYQDRLNG